jgi:hypothetical protein
MHHQLTSTAVTCRRNRRRLPWLFAALCSLLAAAALADDLAGYVYPISDPFEATVTGTPVELKHKFRHKKPMRLDDFELDVFPERELPQLFQSVRKLAFTLAYQEAPAPLLFVIAGTGGSHRSSTSRYLTTSSPSLRPAATNSSPRLPNRNTRASATRMHGICTGSCRCRWSR